MIYKHRFIKQILLQGKQIKMITKQKPLVFVVEEGQFLNYTIQKSMKYLEIPHIISKLKGKDLEQERKNMGHEVPTLIYYNQVLQTHQLIEFICEAFIKDNQQIDFQSRKAYIKQLVYVWKEVFIFQRSKNRNFKQLRCLGVCDKRSYQNLIVQLLRSLQVNFVGKILQRSFAGCNQQSPTIQNIIYVDIINTILLRAPQSFIDYILRSSQKLIQLKDKLQLMIQNSDFRSMHQHGRQKSKHQVILYRPVPKYETNWDNLRINGKRFMIVFGFMTAMYQIFAKP